VPVMATIRDLIRVAPATIRVPSSSATNARAEEIKLLVWRPDRRPLLDWLSPKTPDLRPTVAYFESNGLLDEFPISRWAAKKSA
jgi:hypothetical protein